MNNNAEAAQPQSGSRVQYKASLSTMWGVANYATLKEMFTAAEEMGFAWVELNHMVDSRMIGAMDIENYPVSSIHEPCPADISTQELRKRDWLPTAPDEENRKIGVRAIKNSLDLAHRLGVDTIVMHCGQVQIDHDDERDLRKLYKHEKTNTPEYRFLQERMIRERAERIGPHFAALKKSLLELLEYAAPRGVRIGLENRFHYFDIPLQDEMQELLELADAGRLGYIYDTGHAQALDRLGFLVHEDWLKRFSQRIFITHLHDVRGVDDHWPPGMGDIDYAMIAPYLPDDALRTCEIHGKHTVQQLKNGLLVLEQAGCITTNS